MNFAEKRPLTAGRMVGIGFVGLFHVLLVYALVNGLARKAIEVVRGPMETKIIEELKKLPPPDKPPPPPPKAAEPPPFVPPAEVSVAAPAAPANTITVSTAPPPPKVEAPAPPPPPPRPAVHVPPVIDAAHSCRQPEYPSASRRLEEEGTVVLSFLVDLGGRVTQSKVETSSGFPRLDEAARAALSLCLFKPGTVDGTPEAAWARLKYVWRLE